MIRPIVGLDHVRVELEVLRVPEIQLDWLCPGLEILGLHPADIPDARGKVNAGFPGAREVLARGRVKVTDVAAIHSCERVPQRDIKCIEGSLVGHLPSFFEADAVRAGVAPKPAIAIVDRDPLEDLVWRTRGVLILENEKAIESGDGFIKKDIVLLRSVELAEAQVRLDPMQAVLALGVSEHLAALARRDRYTFLRQVIEAIQVAIFHNGVIIAAISLPGRTVLEHHLPGLRIVHLQGRCGFLVVDQGVVPENLAPTSNREDFSGLGHILLAGRL